MQNAETRKRKEGKNITRETPLFASAVAEAVLADPLSGKASTVAKAMADKTPGTRQTTLKFKGEYFPQFIFRAARGRKISEKLLSLRDFILFFFA